MKRLFSLLIFLVFVELLSIIIVNNDWVLSTTTYNSDAHWKLLWLKRKTLSLYPYDSWHPTLGWYPLKNARNMPTEKARVNFNSQGIRGIVEYTHDKPPDRTRIVLFGDSFSFGEEVNDNETYAARIQAMLPCTEILNLAVHGYGLDQMVLRLALDGPTYHPDIVILAFTTDDLDRLLLSFRDYMKPRFILKGEKLILTGTPIPPPEKLRHDFFWYPKTLDLLSLLADRINPDKGMETVPSLARTLFHQAAQLSQQIQAKPIILFLASGQEMWQEPGVPLPAETLLQSICRSENLTCFSKRASVYDAIQNGAAQAIDAHYSPALHEAIAKDLVEDLKPMLPPNCQALMYNVVE